MNPKEHRYAMDFMVQHADKNQAKDWPLIKLALRTYPWFALLCIALGLLALAGYLLGYEILYRPAADGPATNPLTIMLILMLSTALLCNTDKWLPLRLLLVGFSLLICLLDIAEKFFGLAVFPDTLLFKATVTSDLERGLGNYLSGNTALMLAAIGTSLLLVHFQQVIAAQLLLFAAALIPLISLIGYAYSLEDLYDNMSLLSVAIGFFLIWGVAASTAEQGLIRSLLAPHITGKLLRYQGFIYIAVPFIFGFILLGVFQHLPMNGFGLFVALLVWTTVIGSIVTITLFEKAEQQRQRTAQLLAQVASTDPLTGLYNRRMFLELAALEIKKARRHPQPSWLLIVDVNKFKSVNDSFGHLLGDQVLQAIAWALQEALRDSDVIARIGGDEFAILLNQTNRDGVVQVCSKVVEHIELARAGIPELSDDVATVSVGVAEITNNDLSRLMQQADQAMYCSKNNHTDYEFYRENEEIGGA